MKSPITSFPKPAGEKAFSLLWRAMKEENKVAIAKTVMGVSETLLAIMPTETGLLVEKLYYKDEIKVLPGNPSRPACRTRRSPLQSS